MSDSISDAQKLTSPNPFCLVTSSDEKGVTNVMALSWWTYVSNKPITVAICISQKGYTNKLINKNNEFCLCIVDKVLNPVAFECGTCSGRDINKAETFDIELIKAKIIEPKIVKEHCVAFECKVIHSVPIHDNVMHIAEVRQIHINEEKKPLFALNGYSRLGVVQEGK